MEDRKRRLQHPQEPGLSPRTQLRARAAKSLLQLLSFKPPGLFLSPDIRTDRPPLSGLPEGRRLPAGILEPTPLHYPHLGLSFLGNSPVLRSGPEAKPSSLTRQPRRSDSKRPLK